MRAALYQPDQPGNVGAIVRLGACLGIGIEIILPCGFAFSDRALKRAAMDYAAHAEILRHDDWHSFERQVGGRIILLSTAGDTALGDARFESDDILLFGSESRGVPDHVRACADGIVRIPQVRGTRSLNIAIAAGIALGEAPGSKPDHGNGRDGAYFGARQGARSGAMRIHRDRRGTPRCAKRRPPPSGVARRAAPDVVGPLDRRHHSALRGPPCRHTSPGDHDRCRGRVWTPRQTKGWPQ